MKTFMNNKENSSIQDTKSKALIIHNDDINTFDFIIETLVELCNHDPYQATQCALIAHYKGKCEIKKGHFEELQKLKQLFQNRGITTTIE